MTKVSILLTWLTVNVLVGCLGSIGCPPYSASLQCRPHEEKFSDCVDRVLALSRRESVASGIFGSTGCSGNVALLALLGYGLWISQLSTSNESPY